MKKNLLSRLVAFLIAYANLLNAQNGWQPIGPSNLPIYSMAIDDSNFFVGTDCSLGCVFISTDDGDNWTMANSGLPNFSYISQCGIKQEKVFAVSLGNGMYSSNTNNTDWQHVGFLPITTSIVNFAFAENWGENHILAGTISDGVFISIDNGNNWDYFSNGLPSGANIKSIISKDSKLFVLTQTSVFSYDSNSQMWTQKAVGIPNGTTMSSLGINGENIFLGTEYDGVFISTNNGDSWAQINNGLPTETTHYEGFAFYGSNIFAASTGIDGGVYLSTNDGASWSQANTGFPSGTDINSLLINDGIIYAGTNDNGVFKRAISEITNSQEAVSKSNLFESLVIYPNPTSEKITIHLHSDEAKELIINCTNILDQKIISNNYSLINGELKVDIDLSSGEEGIYLVQIISNGVSICKKITVF